MGLPCGRRACSRDVLWRLSPRSRQLPGTLSQTQPRRTCMSSSNDCQYHWRKRRKATRLRVRHRRSPSSASRFSASRRRQWASAAALRCASQRCRAGQGGGVRAWRLAVRGPTASQQQPRPAACCLLPAPPRLAPG